MELNPPNAVRRFAWRLGRKLYCWAREDLANNPLRNGEYWLIDRVVETCESKSLFVDVGANVGDWSMRALDASDAAQRGLRVVAFEPSSPTRAIMQQRSSGRNDLEILPFALSSSKGEANFYANAVGSGTNSLSARSGPLVETVTLISLDEFLAQRANSHVSLLKVDTEGFDMSVLEGAARSLAEGLIDVVQFEYNWRWLANQASLLTVFNFMADKPYWIGKLSPTSLCIYEEWHFELDRYFENNYVLIKRGHPLERQARRISFDDSNCPVLS